ncbi:MAG TPA: polymer-forming cytoskeletal protein [Ruminiclostridium sp.]|nr:polymer-forming cytoskeletal protein [Ruminiclostridium sp.]
MIKLFHKIKVCSSGSSLLVIIITSTIGVILAAAVTTEVLMTDTASLQNMRSQQAYFSARSAVSATISHLKGLSASEINNYINNGGNAYGTSDQLGKYSTVTSWVDSKHNSLKIVGTGEYQKIKRTAAATICFSNNCNPFNYVFFMKNPVAYGHRVDTSITDGSMLCEGNMILGSSDQVKNSNNIFCSGNITLEGSANITGSVYSNGNIELISGGVVKGNLYAYGSYSSPGNLSGGNISFDGDGCLEGSAYANGNISVPNGKIQSNAYSFKDMTIKNGGVIFGNAFMNGGITLENGGRLNGLATYGTSVTANSGSTVPANILSPNSVSLLTPMDFSFPEKSLTPNLEDDFIRSTGAEKISWSSLKPNIIDNWISLYKIDNTSSDVFVEVNSDVSLSSSTITVTSSAHNVYFYLKGYKRQFLLHENCRVGDKDSRIFILGDGSCEQEITATSDSTLCATIYAPDAAFHCDGDSYHMDAARYRISDIWDSVPIVEGDGSTNNDVKFYGCAIVSTKAKTTGGFTGVDSNAGSSVNIVYNKSTLNYIPPFLLSLAGGGNGGNNGEFNGGGWANPQWSKN